jgi:hypothetical protein
MAFVFTWLMARRFGLSRAASALAAGVYVYSWFPCRTCWEWAIIGGCYLPLTVYCAESFLRTRHQRYLVLISIAIAMQCLAGHFNLCFITLLFTTGLALADFVRNTDGSLDSRLGSRQSWAVVFALLFGLGLASMQLFPSLELKALSQRHTPSQDHNLLFGFLPPQYWTQLTGWYWDEQQGPRLWCSLRTQRDTLLAGLAAPTNQVEAQLYCGLTPLLLALAAGCYGLLTRNRQLMFWTMTASVALLYTGGLFVDWLAALPGFSYFQGPGRFGILVALAVGVLAGSTWDRMATSRSRMMTTWVDLALYCGLLNAVWLILDTLDTVALAGISNPLLLGSLTFDDNWLMATTSLVLVCLVPATAATWTGNRLQPSDRGRAWGLAARSTALLLVLVLDLWPVSRLVTYSPMVARPPIVDLPNSPLRKVLQECSEPVRCFGPGGNFLNVFGVSSLPVYLTFGPAQYADARYTAPQGDPNSSGRFNERQRSWLANMGAPHVVTWAANPDREYFEPVWQGVDQVFNRAMNRGAQPLYLYRIRHTRGRITWVADSEQPQNQRPFTASYFPLRANQQRVRLELPSAGQIVFTELNYPGWHAAVDQVPTQQPQSQNMFRSLNMPAGRHFVNWMYRPASVYWGVGASGVCLVILATTCLFRKRHGSQHQQTQEHG